MSYSDRIEIASYEDLEAIQSFLESVDEPTDDIDPDFTRFFIVRDEAQNRIIGCVGLEIFTGRAMLRSFAIDPEYQETEMGSSLVRKLLDDAFDAGSEAVYVCAANAPDFFWNNEFIGIDFDDIPREIRDSGLFTKDCPRVAAFVRKRIL
ncbi:MAG: GNAT family N-acetyltransferase [Candidatus Thorarchaeota archaeon]|nr:GNAT family N-acetyltransferase [Candidatus Thorarchaeota archaeon]